MYRPSDAVATVCAAALSGFLAIASFLWPTGAQAQDRTAQSNSGNTQADQTQGRTALPQVNVTAQSARPRQQRRTSVPAPEAVPSPEQDQARDTIDRPGSSASGSGLGGRFTGYTPDYGTPAAATKDAIPILQTPANVQVVTRQVMDDHQDISVRDAIVGYVSSVQPPSVTADSSNFYDGFNIRGFDNANIFRNSLRVWEITGIPTANLQSIEILKGPAAMLYGRLEPGGIVNLVVKRPLDSPYASIQQQVGSWGLSRTTFDATGPVTSDKTWLARINVEASRADSFTDFVNSKSVFIAPTITYRPSNQFRFNFDFEYQNSSFVDNSLGIPAVGTRPAAVPISRYLQEPNLTVVNLNRQERSLVGYYWTYDFTNDWSLTNRFAFNNQGYRQFLNGADSFNQSTGDLMRNVWDAHVHARTYATNLDLKGKLTTGPFDHALLIGTDYFYLNKGIEAFFGDNPTIGPINIYAPSYQAMGYTPSQVNSFYPLREHWNGLYAQDMVSFLDNRIHLLFGGRYDWATYGSGYSPNSDAEGEGPYDPVTGIGFREAHDKAFSPRLGIVVQPLRWLSLYGNYTKSFGVTNALPVPGQPLFPPEEAVQREAGIKAELLDKRLTATAAVFDIVKTNVVQALGGTPFATPVGKVESKGFEFDLAGRIDHHWSVIASYSYIDARIVVGQGPSAEDINNGTLFPPTTVVDESGNRLQNVPRNSGAVWAKYDFDGKWQGLSMGAGVVAVGERQGDNQNSFQLPAYARVDTMVQYRFKPPAETQIKNMTLQLNVKNLLDTTYYQNSSSRLNIFPGAPRTVLVSARAEF